MKALSNQVRRYAWGSHTTIAALQGRPVPSAEPEAELWLGAHPSAPSSVDGVSLVDVIAANPEGQLGPLSVAAFGSRLPFLLKVLAAEHPLSLQAHPDADQARAGFAADEVRTGATQGALGGRPRNYVDPYHKPELLVAIDRFEALCGFRDPAESAHIIASFDLPALAPLIAALRNDDTATALRAGVELTLRWPASTRTEVVAAVAFAGLARATNEAPWFGVAARLGREFPGDPGVLLALLLQHVWLSPDDAVFMPAGNLHAYIAGSGIEIMAASDNVLRGGLTPKHTDVDELLRILRYEVLEDPVVRPIHLGPALVTWAAPVSEFGLVKAALAPGDAPVGLPGSGPRILLCQRGPVTARCGPDVRLLETGDSVFVGAAEPPVDLVAASAPGTAGPTGPAVVFQASTAL